MAWMNFDDFLNENPQLKITGMHGPPSPLKLTNDQPNITRKSPESKVKIPKPGPINSPGKKTSTTARKKSRTLNSLSALGSSNIKNNQPFEPITVQYAQKDERLLLKNNLSDRLQEARSSGNKAEETRIMRLMRNSEELKKARKRPYNSPGVIESLQEKVARDKLADPQRALARSAIEDTLGLEVNIYDPRTARWSAFIPDEYTAERVSSGSSSSLRDIKTNPKKFRPISKAQKREARRISKQKQRIFDHEKLFLRQVENDLTGMGMGVPYNVKVGKKMPGMLAGMEDTGLPMGSNQRASAVKQAIANLEVDSLGIANPPDELTRVSVAEGRTNLLGKINTTLPYDAMPVQQTGNWAVNNNPKDRMAAYKEEQKILREQRILKSRQINQMYEDERFFKMSHSALSPFISDDTRFVNMGRGLPPMMQGMDYSDQAFEPIKKRVQSGPSDYVPSFVRRVQSANQASATISSTPMPGSSVAAGATDTATRAGSRVAGMLGEDTVRAASVIHSSKLNYAAVGLAGMAAVFGIASAGRQRKNVEQEIQSRF